MLLVSRLGQTNIAVYGVELLVRQVMDESLAVASTALGGGGTVSRGCDNPDYTPGSWTRCAMTRCSSSPW